MGKWKNKKYLIIKENYLRTGVPFIMGDTEEKEAGGERVKLETGCESNTGSLKQAWGVQGTGRGMALAWRGVAGKE